MTINKINITETINNVENQLKLEKNISPALKALIKLLLVIISLLTDKLGLNSSNSSIPPSLDPNRKKKKKATGKKRKPGGQLGHKGVSLGLVSNPDEIEELEIDRRTLPPGSYEEVGFESRQIIDISVSRHVIEFRAQILKDQNGNKFIAEFPMGVSQPAQYGNGIKSQSVYMSQYQLIPVERVQDYFEHQAGIPISTGSVVNFNKLAYKLLDCFETWVKKKLIASSLLHADETGINVNGKKIWLHNVSNQLFTLFFPHEKRGALAMDEMGILPLYNGTLCHDHWKPYYTYKCTHSLCNAHHLRELDRAFEHDDQQWAKVMSDFLKALNMEVNKAGGCLDTEIVDVKNTEYETIITQADKECPAAAKPEGKKGKAKQTKSRNLLERLSNFKDDVLRFMCDKNVPFTNNLGENDIRMTKVQQKISGCFRTLEGAKTFCRIRSYLSTCRKNGIGPTEALNCLFSGKLPAFIDLE
ncbi:MAG: IS66 family transposase [Flavobacteriaceae bacterium]|nr:IS66 family transposase [Flavobacteriaceae bacterium]